MLPNRAAHVLADLGAVHAGGVPVTFYATLAAEQVGFVAGDCAARIAVLDGADQLARWAPVLDALPELRKVIVLDGAACPPGELYMTWDDFAALGRDRLAAAPELVTGRMAGITPDDPVTLLYTSGTTGNPKGVLITHRSVLYEVAAGQRVGNITGGVRWVSYLPLAHIAERMFTLYIPVSVGGHVHFCPDAKQLVGVVGQVQPTAFFGVPRVWEKVQAGIQALLAAEQDETRKAAVAGRHGHRPAVRGQLPVRPDAPRPSWPRRSAPPTSRCSARSGRCSGWARRSMCPAPRRRCRRTWPRSSPGSA